jgi:MFS family permease
VQPAGAQGVTRLGALRHRDFRLFWSGQLVSLVGTWMQSVGQAWLVLELTQSPFQLGLVGALQFTPILLLSPVGGAVSDRFPKRRVILVTQTAMMLQALALAALVWSGQVRYWHVAALAAIYGTANAADLPARQSYVTDLVGKPDLANAVALNSAVFNGARVVGPAVAGLLVARFGEATAFLLNGLSFLAVLAALLAIHTEGRSGAGGRIGIAEGFFETVTYVLATPRVTFTLGLLVAVSLLVVNFNVVVPLIARDVLKEGAHGFGVLMAALGAGAVTAAVGLALLGGGRPRLWLMAGSASALCAGTVGLALVGRFWTAAALLAALGCFQVLFTTGCNTTLQLATPDALRGRVMGLYALAFAGVTPFGSLLIGTVAEHLGVRVACGLSGGLGLLAVGILVLRGRQAQLWLGLDGSDVSRKSSSVSSSKPNSSAYRPQSTAVSSCRRASDRLK